MPPENICPHCGAPLAAGALAGLCPACLLQQGALADSVAGNETRPFEPPTVAELAPLFPQLEILELIGRGGMGAVYRARQKELDRIVALKILPPEICAAPGFAERFGQEARALAKLNHPGIVTIHDFGRAGALFYFLMEFVDGVNLRQLLTRGRVSPREALAIVPEICDALQFAHDHGIVHRDIKPENILLDRRGRVKVADFGIARMLDAEVADAGFVETQPAGTPQYMAPEQRAQGCPDHRADIYSLGVVLYELLTGELPTDQLQPPSRKVQIDVRLDEIVLRALEKTPGLRYQTAGDFRTQMEAVARGVDGSSEAAPAPGEPSRFSRLAIGGFCLAVLAVFLTVVAGLLAHAAAKAVLPHGETVPGKPIWFYVSTWLVLIPGILAPIGTTMLGWMAITQIRRSAGKIHGLRLAVFDALLFPLLAWLVFVAWFWFWLFDVVKSAVVAEQTGHAQLSAVALILIKHSTGSAFLAFGVTAVLAGFFIVRRFWRRVNTPAGGEALAPPQRFPRWVRIAVPAGAILLFAMIYWSNRPPPIGQWTANRISASAPTTGDIVTTIEEVVRKDHFVWVRLRTSTNGLALKVEPRFDARLSAPPPLGLANAPLRPTVSQAVILELTPDQPPFEYAFTSRDVPVIHGPGEALIGFALPSATAAEVAANQLTDLHLRRPRGVSGERSALLLFNLTARAAKPADNQMLHAWVSFEIVARKPGQALQGQNFGPEIERVLPDPASGVACLLDFETGNFVTPPPALAQKFAAGLADIGDADAQWLRESGADAVVRMSDRSSLRLFEGVALSWAQNQEPPRSWAQFTKADVLSVMQGASWELQQRFVNSGRGFFATPAVSPVALAFITREGNMGVLEIIGPTVNPRGVKIRYKLLPLEAQGAREM